MAQAIAAAGVRLRLATWGWGEALPWPAGVRRVPVPDGGSMGTLRSGPHPSRALHDALLARSVLRELRNDPPAVVHAHHVEGLAIAAWAMRQARSDALLVYNLHTSLEEELPVYGAPWARPWLKRAGRAADRALVRTADLSLSPSVRGAAMCRAWGAKRAVAVLPGVNPEDVLGGDPARARSAWSLQGPVVLYAGNTDRYQDLPVLVAAMRDVRDATLLILTGARDEWLESLIRNEGVEGRVRLVVAPGLGPLRDALAAAQVAVVPRTTCAGFPIKLLNQLAAGVPSVVSAGALFDPDAQAPVVLPGVVTVPDHDPVAMAAAVRRLLGSSDERATLAAAGRDEVNRHWTWTSRAQQIVAAWTEAAGAALTSF